MAASDPTPLSLLTDAVKSLEGKLERGLARIEDMVAGKANESDVLEIRGEVRRIEERVGVLERVEEKREEAARVHAERDQRSFFSRKNRWAVVATVVTVLCTILLAGAAVAGLVIQLSH
jgi:hypothetical protein